jgi:DNA invertase Pin-like site-specific DNA recombinase
MEDRAMKPQAQVKARVALYARVSTTNHKQSNEMQIRDLRPFAVKNHWRVTAVYEDQISSGKERPNLDHLRRDAKAGKFDIVLVWKFDRASRSTLELATLLQEFHDLGIEFISLMENWMDTRTPSGKLVFTVLSAVAEMERANIRERVKAGMRNARAKGKQIGRVKGAHTWRDKKGLTKKGKHLGRPEGMVKVYDSALVAQINALRSRTRENPDGLSYRVIAKQLKLHHMTVYGIVNPPPQAK